jgi:hypothetical protein
MIIITITHTHSSSLIEVTYPIVHRIATMSQLDSEVHAPDATATATAMVDTPNVEPVAATAATATAPVAATTTASASSSGPCKKRKVAAVAQCAYNDLTQAYLSAKGALIAQVRKDLRGLFTMYPALGRVTISQTPMWNVSFESLKYRSDGWIKEDLSSFEHQRLEAWAADPSLKEAIEIGWVWQDVEFELVMDQDGDLQFTIDGEDQGDDE